MEWHILQCGSKIKRRTREAKEKRRAGKMKNITTRWQLLSRYLLYVNIMFFFFALLLFIVFFIGYISSDCSAFLFSLFANSGAIIYTFIISVLRSTFLLRGRKKEKRKCGRLQNMCSRTY